MFDKVLSRWTSLSLSPVHAVLVVFFAESKVLHCKCSIARVPFYVVGHVSNTNSLLVAYMHMYTQHVNVRVHMRTSNAYPSIHSDCFYDWCLPIPVFGWN